MSLKKLQLAVITAACSGLLLTACGEDTPAATQAQAAETIPAPSMPSPTPSSTFVPNTIQIPEPIELEKKRIKIVSVTPNSGTYGVGIPITVTFKNDVPKRHRAKIESMMTVESSRPIQDLAWSWTSAKTVVLRPKDFWPAKTKLVVKAELDGSILADGVRAEQTKFTGGATIKVNIGRAQITRINANTKRAKVYRNGELVKDFPTSLGKQGWETRSGVKVIHERYKVKRMTSEAIGAEEFYELDSPYSLRLTPTGEFLHGAPWATGRLGRANGSHGCTNLAVSDAKWFYDTSLMGDPVITKNTGRKMEPWNGWGGPWNMQWEGWLENSYAGTFAAILNQGQQNVL